VIGDSGEINFNAGVIAELQSTAADQGGDDNITALGGDNTVVGGFGSDTITTDSGNDSILGDNGLVEYVDGSAVRLNSNDGDVGTAGSDIITAGAGNNRVLAGLSGDIVTTLNGSDIVFGDNGQLIFIDGNLSKAISTEISLGGADTFALGDGDNVVIGGGGDDSITSGFGSDRIAADNAEINFDLAGVIENIQTYAAEKSGNDSVTVAGGHNSILAGAGDDSVNTGEGDDVVIGDSGRIDFAEGLVQTILADEVESGSDSLMLAGGNNIALGGDGSDSIVSGDGDDWLVGDSGTFDFESGELNHFVHTDNTDGADTLSGGDGVDVLIGGQGADTLHGQGGHDIIFGDFAEITIADDGTRDIQSILPGIAGDDMITGGEGYDTLIGGPGRDSFDGNPSEDTIVGNYAVLKDQGSSAPFMVMFDPSKRETTSSTINGISEGDDLSTIDEALGVVETAIFAADDRLAQEESAAVKPLRTDVALRLTPLLNGREFNQMSDTELTDFLRNLPLTPAEGSNNAGSARSSDASQQAPVDSELPSETDDTQKPVDVKPQSDEDASTELDLLEMNVSNDSPASDDLSVEMLASLVIAAKSSRKRGWELSGLGDNHGKIDGNLGSLRDDQADRQFKPWQRH
jgi:Ca2+-binding RTX toxin-like protein